MRNTPDSSTRCTGRRSDTSTTCATNRNTRTHAGALNYVRYNPNAGCGGSDVYIENKATALLYIYTPYQPNEAALKAGAGEGDACSTYGNRNFAIIYNSMFGNPRD